MSDNKVLYFFTSFITTYKDGSKGEGHITHSSNGYNNIKTLKKLIIDLHRFDTTEITNITIMSNTEIGEMHYEVLQQK